MKMFTLLLVGLFFSSITSAQVSQNALNFDGTDDFVQTTYPGISGTGARTIEAWIKTTANSNPGTSGVQHIIADYGSFVTGGRFTFNVLWGNAIRIEVGGSGLSGNIAVNDGNWHHVAVTYDPSASDNYHLYVDGNLDTSGNISTSTNTVLGTDLIIGKRVDNARYWIGEIDEVRFWNYAKTALEIDSLSDLELCPNQFGLAAYYRLNQGNASGNNSGITTAIDNSTSSNNGTLSNFGLSGSSSNWVNGTNISLAPDTTINIDTTVCGGFASPKGNFILFSGTVTDNLTNALGCDSFINYNVTVNQNNFSYDSIYACDSFRTSSGILKTQTEVFTTKYTNAAGCDSTIQTLLIINETKRDTLDVTTCYNYTSPTGKVWTGNGIYTDTLQSLAGCDSILYVNLTILSASYVNLEDTACSQYLSPSGVIYYASGTYMDTIQNQNNCDSIVTISLTINHPNDTMITSAVCDSFTSESGMNKWYSTGTYNEILTNQMGCDSIINYDLTINSFSTASIDRSECGPFTAQGGTFIASSGVYTDIIMNDNGCDSIITINATIIENTPLVTKNGDTLEVNVSGLEYQWLNCENNFTEVSGANNQKYRPTVSGNYAIEVEENNCKDTSQCINFPSTAFLSKIPKTSIQLLPNPASNKIEVSVTTGYDELIVTNNLGQVVLTTEIDYTINTIDISQLEEGIYFLKIRKSNDYQTVKFMVMR